MEIRTMQEWREEQHCKMAMYVGSNMTGIGQEIWSVEADESTNGHCCLFGSYADNTHVARGNGFPLFTVQPVAESLSGGPGAEQTR
jgi:hypothetical protein